jgi:hypothetical protein
VSTPARAIATLVALAVMLRRLGEAVGVLVAAIAIAIMAVGPSYGEGFAYSGNADLRFDFITSDTDFGTVDEWWIPREPAVQVTIAYAGGSFSRVEVIYVSRKTNGDGAAFGAATRDTTLLTTAVRIHTFVSPIGTAVDSIGINLGSTADTYTIAMTSYGGSQVSP